MRQSHNEEAPSHEYVRQDTSQFRPTPHASSHNNACIADARIYNTRSACTNSASGTHRALVGAISICPLHIAQPAGLAQHADTPSAQVQTQRASRSTRACCGGALTREGQARTPVAPPRGRGDGYAPTPRAHGSRFACVRDLAQHADTPRVRPPTATGTHAKRGLYPML